MEKLLEKQLEQFLRSRPKRKSKRAERTWREWGDLRLEKLKTNKKGKQ